MGTCTLCIVAQTCPILCNPMDCSTPGSSDHGISQERILEWVATSYSRGSSQPQRPNSHLLCLLQWQADCLSPAPSGRPA